MALLLMIALSVPKWIEWVVSQSYLNGGLYAAVQQKDIDEVRRMLQLGANLNATNDQGEAVITLAKKLKQNEIVKVLRAAGASSY